MKKYLLAMSLVSSFTLAATAADKGIIKKDTTAPTEKVETSRNPASGNLSVESASNTYDSSVRYYKLTDNESGVVCYVATGPTSKETNLSQPTCLKK